MNDAILPHGKIPDDPGRCHAPGTHEAALPRRTVSIIIISVVVVVVVVVVVILFFVLGGGSDAHVSEFRKFEIDRLHLRRVRGCSKDSRSLPMTTTKTILPPTTGPPAQAEMPTIRSQGMRFDRAGFAILPRRRRRRRPATGAVGSIVEVGGRDITDRNDRSTWNSPLFRKEIVVMVVVIVVVTVVFKTTTLPVSSFAFLLLLPHQVQRRLRR